MNRRTFLKSLFGLPLLPSALAASGVAVPEHDYSDFDENDQYGDYIAVTEYSQEVLNIIYDLIAEHIPTTHRKWVTTKYVEPRLNDDPLCQLGYVLWKYKKP